jgi:hypothetical protein
MEIDSRGDKVEKALNLILMVLERNEQELS